MNKLLKLQAKAEKCLTRKKAQKVLKKWHKFEKPVSDSARRQKPPQGPAIPRTRYII